MHMGHLICLYQKHYLLPFGVAWVTFIVCCIPLAMDSHYKLMVTLMVLLFLTLSKLGNLKLCHISFALVFIYRPLVLSSLFHFNDYGFQTHCLHYKLVLHQLVLLNSTSFYHLFQSLKLSSFSFYKWCILLFQLLLELHLLYLQ